MGGKSQGFQEEVEAWRRMEGKGQVLQGSVQGWGVSVAVGGQKRNMSTGVNLILSPPPKNPPKLTPSHTYIHGSDVIIIGLSHFLHDFLLSQAAGLNSTFHGDGPLRIIQGQILQPAQKEQQSLSKS